MVTLILLPPEIHLEIFKNLPDRVSLIAAVLSCRDLYYSFLTGDSNSILECIRFNEVGCGAYADALIYSLRLLEPDIGVEHVQAWAESFHAATKRNDHSWAIFSESIPAPGVKNANSSDDRRSWKEWIAGGYYSRTSFCYYNQNSERRNDILWFGSRQTDRWWVSYRLVRLLALQCSCTRLRQGFGDINDYSRIFEDTEQPPPTETELRRVERGFFVLWIMVNVASLIYRPDFLSRAGNSRAERTAVQRNLRRVVISSFDVWDWRTAMSIRYYMLARLEHIDTQLKECRRGTLNGELECMWEDLPAELRYKNWYFDYIIDSVVTVFSPPGAMQFFSLDQILKLSGSRDSEQLQRLLTQRSVMLNLAERERIKHSIYEFGDIDTFFWRMKNYNKELSPWSDMETLYPSDKYPDRKRLPLEKPRAIIQCKDGPSYCTNGDSGWAWKRGVDCDRCMWDDWRLVRYANYHKPTRMRWKRPPEGPKASPPLPDNNY